MEEPLSPRSRAPALLDDDSHERPLEPRSSPSTPTHRFQHRPTLLKRLKSIRGGAKRVLNPLHHPPPPASGSPVIRRPSNHRSITATSSLGSANLPTLAGSEQRPAIKIRLITWNQHEELPDPSGDLTELLGDVRNCKLRNLSSSTSASGGANGGTSTDDGTSSVIDSIVSVPLAAALPPLALDAGHPYHLVVVAGQECPTASGVAAFKTPRRWDGKGWTTMLENWLCGGSAESDDESSDGDEEEIVSGGEDALAEADSVKSKGTRATATSLTDEGTSRGDNQGGPYILVEKERLMGIYLAVFVLKSCDAFIRGTSKGRVTAGLLGGRLGNKGGVGISLSFAGSRLLFISAHLAAHASGLEIRKANIRKIMEELEVDDFTAELPDGRELTERFDQTFFMGDLNMRLGITRLHADFLLKSPSGYLTALEFDQLRGVLAERNSVLQGFHEGAITFAPTYKYDVIQKPKQKRNGGRLVPKSMKRTYRDAKSSAESAANASDSVSLRDGRSDGEAPNQSPWPKEKDPDSLSVVSDDSVSSTMSDYTGGRSDFAGGLNLAHLPEATVDAVRRAQVRFLTLVRSNSTAGAGRRLTIGDPTHSRKIGANLSPPASATSSPGLLTPARPTLRSIQSEVVVSHGPSLPALDDEAIEASFDTSRKQRVQSYTDRILFKSTVGVGPEPEHHQHISLVDSLKGLLHPTPSVPDEQDARGSLHHAYFAARPILDPPSQKITDIKTAKPWSDIASVAGEPRHTRFANFFGRGYRRGLTARSSENLAEPTSRATSPELKRTRSLCDTPVGRRRALAQSLGWTDGTGRIWRRPSFATSTQFPADADPLSPATTPVPSTPILTSPPLPSDPSSIKDLASPSTAPTFPVTEPSSPSRARPRQMTWDSTVAQRPPLTPVTREVPSIPATTRRFSLADTSLRPSTSSSFFRTSTISRTFTRASATPTLHLGRFKSFLHSLPIPFLSTLVPPQPSETPIPSPPPRTGPRKGEVQVIRYDAVTDLKRMAASSDHRPVYLVAAIGIGEDDEDGERAIHT